MFGTDGNDTIFGTDDGEAIIAGAGDDIESGYSGNDTSMVAMVMMVPLLVAMERT